MRSAKLPTSRSVFNQKAEEFREWLVRNGSAIFAPTNPYEVIRFLSPTGVAIIWTDKNGKLSFSPDAQDTYLCFLNRRPWRPIERGTGVHSKRRKVLVRNLVARDGYGCFYCAQDLTLETATIEHMIPLTSGGSSHMNNLTLACYSCNSEADTMSVREKLELAIRKRGGYVRRRDHAGDQRQAAQADGDGPCGQEGEEDGFIEGEENCLADEPETA